VVERHKSMRLQLPPVISSVLLNIGSNTQPLNPPAGSNSTAVVAFEPIVYAQIQPCQRLYVVPAAVSNESGLALMGVYNANGLSSSLAEPVGNGRKWQRVIGETSPHKTVPVVSMYSVLESLRGVRILLLKTDMQGYDFHALQSAGNKLKSVPYIMAECSVEDTYSYGGVGAANDYCHHHLPHFLSLGYIPRGVGLPRNKWLVAPAGGVEAARQYCEGLAKRRRRREAQAGNLEANGFWQLNQTSPVTQGPEEFAQGVGNVWPPWYLLPGARRCSRCSESDLAFVDGKYTRKELVDMMVDPEQLPSS